MIEEASAHGLELVIVSGMAVGQLDALLAARPAGPGGLILATRWGCQVFSVDRDGLTPAFGTTARITGDVHRLEVEPTHDARWVMPWLRGRGIAPEQVLIAGGRDVVVAVLQDRSRAAAPASSRSPRKILPGRWWSRGSTHGSSVSTNRC